MRGILSKGFSRRRALSSMPHGWPQKRRKGFPLIQNKLQKLSSMPHGWPRKSRKAFPLVQDKLQRSSPLPHGWPGKSRKSFPLIQDKRPKLSPIPHGWPPKRSKGFPLVPVKHRKLTAPIFSQQEIAEDDDVNEEGTLDEDVLRERSVPEELSENFEESNNVLGSPIAPKVKWRSSCYPYIVYEGNIATAMLGVGQMVTLDGCAMVQVVEGQASMLGHSFSRGASVLVCSSSKLAKLITIEAGPVSRDGRAGDADVNMDVEREKTKSLEGLLGCQLRFSSYTLGQNVWTTSVLPGRSISFKLEFVRSQGSTVGKKRGRELLDEEHKDGDFRDINELVSGDDELDLDSETRYSDSEDRYDRSQVPVEDVASEVALELKGHGLNTFLAKKQRIAETSDDCSSPTTLPCDWKEAVITITLGSIVPVVAVCGAKNVGKSTFARFLVNSLLNRYKEVAYLDTDVGQPEFTAPGCISLHVLDSPVVGPPAMHLRSPDRCFFYGDISPKSNPLMYGELVAGLVHYFCEKYSVDSASTIPLVINTHGWVKGIGYDVVVDILNSTSPTHVVQVLANSEKKNLPRNKFWDELSTAETVYVESAVEKLPMRHLRSARSARHLRTARLLAYFQQCFGENSAPFPYRETKLFAQATMSLVRDTAYVVPFTALTIWHLHSEVPSSDSLMCVNATIVGLGTSSVGKDTVGDKDGLRSLSLPLCLGLGIVKAVDMKRGVFYITTPVPQEQLQYVDILLKGRVEIPVPLLMARGFMCPYLKKSSPVVERISAGTMKSTHYLTQ